MHKIKYYKKKFESEHKPGTSSWLENRKYSFGGSEIGALLGHSKYDKPDKIIERKITGDCIVNDAVTWGSIFEPISKKFIEKKYGTIYEIHAIPHCYYPVCYSSDGIILNEDKTDIILLEIKNPISRNIHSIPKHYMDQILAGLNIFSCQYGLFCQFRFRRCKMTEKPWTCTYDRFYHKEWRKRCADVKPISFGYIYWPGEDPLLDLCSLEIMHPKIPNHKPEIIIDTLFHEKNPLPEKGTIMMWKLFEQKFEKIENEPDFLKKNENKLWKDLETLYNKQDI